ncbi:MAG: hypothetical protein ABIJ00_10950 [Candidatus Eisenbacteria bacterium]
MNQRCSPSGRGGVGIALDVECVTLPEDRGDIEQGTLYYGQRVPDGNSRSGAGKE